ncbi:GlxA family transcriptional regulator [Skermanella mucosa]|uniref:GlxA family transcriptional regulator n=1 Tax=Skermanella mucosa TaxID=1789672 RepID=UPI00192AC2A5|nr:GlxA family transcriptional regulator [Skermanella mucosa]UEM19914.1 GlxA family transcriptional regulator [Skermanella mucosa]
MQRVGFILIPRFQMMTLAAASVFEFANMLAGETLYEISVLSETGGPVASSLGMIVETVPFEPCEIDTLIVGAGLGPPRPTAGLLDLLRSAQDGTRRIAAICNGTFILAEAGLLDGRRATTHWRNAIELQARFPAIKVEEDRIFIIDGVIWTSAGATAGIDLALAMVEKDFGSDVARHAAKSLVVYHRRAGGQSQHSALLDMSPKSDRVQNALAYAKEHLADTISVEQLADAAHLSPRQFSRTFLAETGRSPAKAVEQLRVEAARLMMEQGRHSMDEVARETGFADRDRMRRAFVRAFGQPPQTIRRNDRLSQMA